LVLMDAPAFQPDSGPCHEVFDRSRHENLVGARQGGDASTNVHGDTIDAAILAMFELTGVEAGADLNTERTHAVTDRLRAGDRPSGTIEHGEGTIACGIDQPAADPTERPAHRAIV